MATDTFTNTHTYTHFMPLNQPTEQKSTSALHWHKWCVLCTLREESEGNKMIEWMRRKTAATAAHRCQLTQMTHSQRIPMRKMETTMNHKKQLAKQKRKRDWDRHIEIGYFCCTMCIPMVIVRRRRNELELEFCISCTKEDLVDIFDAKTSKCTFVVRLSQKTALYR